MGATLTARAICCALKFETPIFRILPSALSFANSPNSLFNRPGRGRFRVALPRGPVDLIEIDRIEPQSLQAGFGFSSNGGRLQIVGNGSGFIPDQAALGEDIRTLA